MSRNTYLAVVFALVAVAVALVAVALALLTGGGGVAARAQKAVRAQTGNVHLRVSDCVKTADGGVMSTFDQWSCVLSDPVSGARRSVRVGYWPDNDIVLPLP